MTNIILLSTCLVTNRDGEMFIPDAVQASNTIYWSGHYQRVNERIDRISTIGFMDGTNKIVLWTVTQKEGTK